jgi:hypothetical protein
MPNCSVFTVFLFTWDDVENIANRGLKYCFLFSRCKSGLGYKAAVVVTVCGHANENCPFFLGALKIVNVGFQDPLKMALEGKTDEEKHVCYRSVRAEIRRYNENLAGVIQ